ncbi:flagellar basal body rod protein FlgB [Marinicrinis sediminis]|uniref:Flagellar basal body rod protein FlgB n=1 Tax=Marinicrinis sediminis TaxID=1652465 RepID=A0ABW5R6S3_9BACL
MDLLNTRHLSLIESTLDASALRQKVIANNIANVDTPNFKRSDVKFEQLLAEQMNGGQTLTGMRTNERHIPIGNIGLPQQNVEVDQSTAFNNNGNNVDMDYEMALMAKNQLRYNTLVQQMNHDLKMIRTAIGRG